MDFRSILYSRYGLNRSENSRLNDDALLSFWVWCKHKYLPLLKGLNHDDPILELGCGHGYILEFLRRNGFSNVEGIDISEQLVQIAIARGLNVKVADVFEYLRYSAKDRFSAIIALNFIEHFTKEELMRLMPNIYKALKKGGVLIILTPNGAGLFPHQVVYGDCTHMTIFTPQSLQEILELVGFGNFEFQETGPVPKDFQGKLRVILWKCIKIMANIIRLIESGSTQSVWTENMICFCRKLYT